MRGLWGCEGSTVVSVRLWGVAKRCNAPFELREMFVPQWDKLPVAWDRIYCRTVRQYVVSPMKTQGMAICCRTVRQDKNPQLAGQEKVQPAPYGQNVTLSRNRIPQD